MIYLDNAATTFVDKEAINIIQKSLAMDYINPSSLYNQGRKLYDEIQLCKKTISKGLGLINAENNIYFTSGGCEGNNWIIKGCIAEYYRYYQYSNIRTTIKKPHIITTSFEHHSVLNACKQLELLGLAKVTYIKPNVQGIVDPIDIERNISHLDDEYQTILVSVMWVNNVLGTMQFIKEIGEICKKYFVRFHTDAVQAVGNTSIDLSQYNIDFLTVSGHKFHAPKGIGFVYMKDSRYVQPMISGGGQEFGLRAGTENLPYIKALTYCFEKYTNPKQLDSKHNYIELMKNYICKSFEKSDDCICFESSDGIGTINLAFKDIISDMLVYNLGERGCMVSVGSACDNGNFEDSHVLTSVGYSDDYINGNIRITFNEFNTMDEIKTFIEILKEEVIKLRGY